jgi:hypothetical protein
MKTLAVILGMFALSVVFSSNQAEAAGFYKGNNCAADVQLNAKNQIVVRYLNCQGMKVSIEVLNEKGKSIYEKNYRNEGNIKLVYDVDNLSSGVYTFTVKKEGELLLSEQITLKEGKVAYVPTVTYTASPEYEYFTNR